MKSLIGIIGLPVLFGLFAANTAAETFTMETTYPSPLGAYDKVNSNQLRLTGYTQAEIDAGALQNAAQKAAKTPPSPGIIFFNKTDNSLYYTNPKPDPEDPGTWYLVLGGNSSSRTTYTAGGGALCGLRPGVKPTITAAGSTDFSSYKNDYDCYGRAWATINPVTEGQVGSTSGTKPISTYPYGRYPKWQLRSTKPIPGSAKNWVFNASCKIIMSGMKLPACTTGGCTAGETNIESFYSPGLKNKIGLYKKIKTTVGAANDPQYVPLESQTGDLRFNIAYRMYVWPMGYVSVTPRAYVPFKNVGSSWEYSFNMNAVKNFRVGTKWITQQVLVYAATDVKLTDDTDLEPTYQGDAAREVYYITNPNATPPTAQQFGYQLPIGAFTQRLECSSITGEIVDDIGGATTDIGVPSPETVDDGDDPTGGATDPLP